jgi:DNA polymerase
MKKSKKLQTYINFLSNQTKGFLYKGKNTKSQTKKNKEEQLKKLYSNYKNCQECPLAKLGRTQVVFGHGNPKTKLMFVGEGPGKDEDLQGSPFVGKAGKLLTKIINAMNLQREDVYITNVVKCRPPNNRLPLPQESEICKNLILFREIEIINPHIICTLGSCATQALLGDTIKITKVRGIFSKFYNHLIMPTFHPAYLLRNPIAKKAVWEDMKKIMEKLKTP